MIKKLSVLIKVKHIYLIPFLLLLVFTHYTEAASNIHSEATDRKKTIQILLQAIKETTDKIPQSFDNANALAKELNNVEAIHQWVHEHTVLSPYAGSLKGAKGVMIDREGNSLDRSLLMAKLLKQKGYKVRLARTQINQQKAEMLFEETLKFPENLDHLVPRATKQLQKEIIKIIPSEFLAKINKESTAATDLLYNRFEVSAGALLPAAKKIRKYQIEDQVQIEKRQQIENLQDHWWVQAEIEGQWKDFDAVFTVPGKRLSNSIKNYSVNQLPNDLIHRVTIEIVAEVTDSQSGKTENHTLLNAPLVASDLRDASIEVSIIPTDGPEENEIKALVTNKVDLFSRLQNIKWWLPVVRINKNKIFNKSVSTSGEIREKKDLQLRSSNINTSTKKITSAFGLLNTSISGSSNPSKSKQPIENTKNENSVKELTGMWLNFSLSPSTSRAKVTRRIIYQKPKNKTNDRALKLLSNINLSIVTNKSSEMYFSSYIKKKLKYFKKMLDNNGSPEVILELTQFNIKMFNYLQNKMGLGLGGLYLYEPQIYILKYGLTLGSDNKINHLFTFDIVKNEFNARLIYGVDPYESRVLQGIIDTAAETAFSFNNVAAKNATISLHKETDKNNKLSIDTVDENSYIIDFYRKKGYILLSNKKKENNTFWRIDSSTGDILGMTDQGEGGVTEEVIDRSITIKQGYELINLVGCYYQGKNTFDNSRPAHDRVRSGFNVSLCFGTVLFRSLYFFVPASVGAKNINTLDKISDWLRLILAYEYGIDLIKSQQRL